MDRDELHRRVMMLKQELKAGRVKFREGLDVAESLKRVRFGPDGKVDPDTVDPIVRALALAVQVGVDRREAKQIPLKESQTEYFTILEKFFGAHFVQMKKHKVTPPDIANYLASKPKIVEAFAADSKDFFEGVREFWNFYGPTVEVHLQDMKALKAVFGGDIFPSYAKNIATSAGLYIDTLVLPDPLLRMADFLETFKPERALYYAFKHALNALQYKDLALADVEPPIVVVAPGASFRDDHYLPVLKLAGEHDLLSHATKMFERSFFDLAELTSFLSQYSTSEQLAAGLADPSRLLFDTEWGGPIAAQIERFKSEFASELRPKIENEQVGQVVYDALFGRMMQANDVILRASRYAGHPLIDAPTSWQYLLWKYEYDGPRPAQSVAKLQDILISKAISVEGSASIGLIANVPPESLIELRRAGAMTELRNLIRTGLKEVDEASEAALADVGEAVVANLNAAFQRHKKELEELSSKKKLFGLDVAKWITVGGLTIGAATTGNTALGVLGALGAMFGIPSVKELTGCWRDIQEGRQQIARSPSGILFRHLNDK